MAKRKRKTVDWGGMGGIADGRKYNPDNKFECAVETALGNAIREDDGTAVALWSALANVQWFHKDGDRAEYSFRAAGDLVAAIRGQGNYMDWYCSGPYAQVSEGIAKALAKHGWKYRFYGEHAA